MPTETVTQRAAPAPGPNKENDNNVNDREDHDIGQHGSIDADDFAGISFEDLPDDDDGGDEGARNRELIAASAPETPLEHALRAELDRQIRRNRLLANECAKLRGFLAKRKQTYKRLRKDKEAPRKKLSGYNLFVREHFAKLTKENEEALRNLDGSVEMKRVPPARNIVASGRAWSMLSADRKSVV